MNKQDYNRDFLIWKANLSSYVFKIIKRLPNEIKSVDLRKLYKEHYHPYVGAVTVILNSDEYKKEEFYHDFIIPYKDRVVIVNKTKNL